MKHWTGFALTVLLITGLLAGCQTSNTESHGAFDNNINHGEAIRSLAEQLDTPAPKNQDIRSFNVRPRANISDSRSATYPEDNLTVVASAPIPAPEGLGYAPQVADDDYETYGVGNKHGAHNTAEHAGHNNAEHTATEQGTSNVTNNNTLRVRVQELTKKAQELNQELEQKLP